MLFSWWLTHNTHKKFKEVMNSGWIEGNRFWMSLCLVFSFFRSAFWWVNKQFLLAFSITPKSIIRKIWIVTYKKSVVSSFDSCSRLCDSFMNIRAIFIFWFWPVQVSVYETILSRLLAYILKCFLKHDTKSREFFLCPFHMCMKDFLE